MRDGRVGAAFTSEGWPEVMLELEGDIGRVVENLPTEGLVYDCDEFLLGGLHLDFDRREILIWRTWGTNNALEPPAHWSDWKIVDFGHRYREFYSSTPNFIGFVPRSEDSYLRKIGDHVCNERWGGTLRTGSTPVSARASSRRSCADIARTTRHHGCFRSCDAIGRIENY